MVDALSPAEWLEAARRRLGAPPDAPLRLERVWPAEGSDDVSGFVGDALGVRVRVRGPAAEDDAESEARELALFLKMVPRNCPAGERLAITSLAFHKEIGLFERVFTRLEAGAGASVPWGPRCVLTRPHLLVMEDLAAAGFQTLGNRHTLDGAHASLALATLARFHAAALALEAAEGKPLNLLYPDLVQENSVTKDFECHLSIYFRTCFDTIAHLLSLVPRYRSSVHYETILTRLFEMKEEMYELIKPTKRFRNTLGHGDIWVCNLMFRYSKEGAPVDARLIDFQLARYCPPAVDVMSLLHLTMRREAREALLPQLLAGYHAELAAELARRGLDAERLLPRRQLDESCAAFTGFARALAAGCHSTDLLKQEVLREATTAAEDDSGSLLTADRRPLAAAAFANDPEYRQRLSEDLAELVDLHLLPPGAAKLAF